MKVRDRVLPVGSGVHGRDLIVGRYTSSGVLDNTFGTGGKVFVDFSTSNDGGDDLAIDSYGRIIVVGNNNDLDFAVARLNSDGSPDLSFSSDGQLLEDFSAAADEAVAVSIVPGSTDFVEGKKGTFIIQ